MPENGQPWVNVAGAIILGGTGVLAALITPATKMFFDGTPAALHESASPSAAPRGVKPPPAAAGDDQRLEAAPAAAGDEQQAEVVPAADVRLLAEARNAELAKQPLLGLHLLDGADPTGRLAGRFREQRKRLSDQLAAAPPPAIELGPGFKLEYKGAQIAVPLRITDDLAGKSAKCWARPEGGAWQVVPVRQLNSDDYEVDIPPELHQNRTVELYATVSDDSGRQSPLGTSDKPVRIKRHNWFKSLFGRARG